MDYLKYNQFPLSVKIEFPFQQKTPEKGTDTVPCSRNILVLKGHS